MVDTSGLTTEVQSRVQNISSTLSAGSIRTTMEYLINYIENFTGDSISTTTVPDKYQNIIVNLTSAHILANKLGGGVAFNFELGEFSVDRGNIANGPDTEQMNFYLNQANAEMKWTGRKSRFRKIYGV